MIFGLWGMWASRRHWREHSIFYAQFVAFAAVTAVFFGHTSYRAYLDVYWIVFAAGVLATWLSKSPSRKLPGASLAGRLLCQLFKPTAAYSLRIRLPPV